MIHIDLDLCCVADASCDCYKQDIRFGDCSNSSSEPSFAASLEALLARWNSCILGIGPATFEAP